MKIEKIVVEPTFFCIIPAINKTEIIVETVAGIRKREQLKLDS